MLRTRKALSLRVTLSSMASISGAASLRGNSEPSLYALRVLPTNFRDSSYKCWARGNSSASSTWGGGGAQSAFLIAGMSEPFMANLSFKNLTLIFIGEYYYSVSVKAADKKKELLWNCLIRLLPWAEKTVTVSLPDRIHPIGRLKEI